MNNCATLKKLKLDDILETERLIIKIPEVSEAEEMYHLIDDSTIEFMVWDKGEDFSSVEKNLNETIEECKKGESWQAALYLKNGELIGRFGMHTINEEANSIYLGYWLATEYKGNGYIPECVECIKKYGFQEMGLNKVMIRCVKENTASRRVAEKAGFTLDGILRNDTFEKGKYVDNCYYSFLKEEYA